METQVVLVKKGMSASQVIRHLKSSSIIESDLPIRIWAKVDFRKIQEGEYLIPPRATLFEIISIIWGGHSTFVELVIPEGTNSWQRETPQRLCTERSILVPLDRPRTHSFDERAFGQESGGLIGA